MFNVQNNIGTTTNQMARELMTTPQDIVDFWLGEAASDPAAAKARTTVWYGGKSHVDQQIQDQFGETLALAEQGNLDEWRNSSEGALALVILLDQFSRNLYRRTGDAFKNDAKALEIARSAVEQGLHKEMSWIGRVFLYHPFHHAESLEAQDQGVERFEEVYREASPEWAETLYTFVDYARGHRDIVRRFGRFPHRNEALGRENTIEEAEYLETAKRYGQ